MDTNQHSLLPLVVDHIAHWISAQLFELSDEVRQKIEHANKSILNDLFKEQKVFEVAFKKDATDQLFLQKLLNRVPFPLELLPEVCFSVNLDEPENIVTVIFHSDKNRLPQKRFWPRSFFECAA